MRAELQQLDRIDAYLDGSMSTGAREQFEQELLRSSELRELVENQQLVIRTIRRQALRAEIVKYGATASPMSSWMKWLSIGIVAAGLISAGIYWKFAKKNQHPLPVKQEVAAMTEAMQAVHDSIAEQYTTPEALSEGMIGEMASFASAGTEVLRETVRLERNVPQEQRHEAGGLKTWITPHRQYFSIDPAHGRTIACENGTLIIVPENAFLDEQGRPVRTEVQLEVIEALSVADMLAYNLTTMNGDKLLRSGGMIYMQPTNHGQKVKIDPKRPLYIEIPAEKTIPGMLAWKGETDAAGDINWTTPRPLEKFLVPVRFELLDFLPPGFEAEVEASLPFRGHTGISKKLADSLYYALAGSGGKNFFPINQRTPEEESFQVKKNTYALNGRVIEKGMIEPVEKAKVLIYNFDNRDEIERMIVKNKPYATPEEREKVYNAYRLKLRPIDSTLTGIDGSFTFRNMNNQNIYFRIIHPDYEDFQSGDLILPLNRMLTFQPQISLKRIRPRNAREIASKQIARSAYKDSLNSCMIDPLSIQTIRSKEFENTFLATHEFEARIRQLHSIEEPQSLLEIYIAHLDGNLWEADSLVTLQLQGEYERRFRDFAAERLTNVNNDGIYQQKLSAYYNQERKERHEALQKLRGKYLDKTREQLLKLGEESADLQSRYATSGTAGVPEPPEDDLRNFQPDPAVNSSYGVKWYEPGWVNIDCYNHMLSKGSQEVAITVNKSDGRVYQSINPIQTIVPLVITDGNTAARFPVAGSEESKLMQNTYCIGIRKESSHAEIVSYAEAHYDPYRLRELQLEWEDMSGQAFYKRLKALPDASPEMMAFVKAEEQAIDYRRTVRMKEEANKAEMLRIRETAAREKAMMDRLRQVAGGCPLEPLSL